jgi:urease beta subunit
MTGFLFWLFMVAPLRFDKSDTRGSILELSIRAGFAVRFCPRMDTMMRVVALPKYQRT